MKSSKHFPIEVKGNLKMKGVKKKEEKKEKENPLANFYIVL